MNQNKINDHNKKQEGKGPRALRLATNWTQDLEPEEYEELLGLDKETAEAKKTTLGMGNRNGGNNYNSNGLGGLGGRGNGRSGNGLGGGRRNGRHLDHAATTVDHHADGWMHDVKNQGNCGSCWAFAATTALEGTLAKKTNSAPIHMSEQQLVDCTLTTSQANYDRFGKDYYSYGCQGGWMEYAW